MVSNHAHGPSLLLLAALPAAHTRSPQLPPPKLLLARHSLAGRHVVQRLLRGEALVRHGDALGVPALGTVRAQARCRGDCAPPCHLFPLRPRMLTSSSNTDTCAQLEARAGIHTGVRCDARAGTPSCSVAGPAMRPRAVPHSPCGHIVELPVVDAENGDREAALRFGSAWRRGQADQQGPLGQGGS